MLATNWWGAPITKTDNPPSRWFEHPLKGIRGTWRSHTWIMLGRCQPRFPGWLIFRHDSNNPMLSSWVFWMFSSYGFKFWSWVDTSNLLHGWKSENTPAYAQTIQVGKLQTPTENPTPSRRAVSREFSAKLQRLRGMADLISVYCCIYSYCQKWWDSRYSAHSTHKIRTCPWINQH